MKDLLFVNAGLLIVIWALIYWGFTPNGSVHIILVIACIIILIRIFFHKFLSSK